MIEESNTAVRRQPPSAKSSTKLLTRTSILMVSVLMAANMILTEGISYSNAGSILVPSFAPTSLANAPSSKPTQQQHRSSKKGKHRKTKANSHKNTPPAFGGLESNRRRKTSRKRPNERETEPPVRRKKGQKQQQHSHNRLDSNSSNNQNQAPAKTLPKVPKRKSPKTLKPTPTSAAEASASSPNATARIPSKKFSKKHRHRRKAHAKPETTIVEATATTPSPSTSTSSTSTSTPKIEESIPKTKGTKRKRKKQKSPASKEPEPVATTTTTTTAAAAAAAATAMVETSAPSTDEKIAPEEEADNSKPKRKKKRRKKHPKSNVQASAALEPEIAVEDSSAANEIEPAMEEAEKEIPTLFNDQEVEPNEENAKNEIVEEAIPDTEVCEQADEQDGVEEEQEEVTEIEEEESPPVDKEDAVEVQEETEIVQEEAPQVEEEEVVEEAIEEVAIAEEPIDDIADEDIPEEGGTEVLAGKATQVDAVVEVEAEEGDEETNEIVEQVEDPIEPAQEESIQENADVDEDNDADIVEAEVENEGEADVVDEETIIEKEDGDDGSLATSEIVAEDEEPAGEEEIEEAEIQEEDDENDNDNDEDPGTPITQNSKTEAQHGASVKDGEDVSSSNEGSDIDPDQDVVSFIEEVLDENVRDWLQDSDTHHAEAVIKKARGGHIDTITTESEVEEKIEGNAEVAETPEVVEEENEAANEKPKVLDRKSLETSGDKGSDAVVSVVTWNLAEDSPEEEDAAFIRKFRKNGALPDEGSDLVLISGQECENIKPRRSEGRRSREYRRLMIKMLGRGYVPLALHLLGGIQFGLFAKRSFLKEIEDVTVADVTCGIGNVFHNKGAIAAFLKIKARNQDADGDQKRAKTLRMVFVAAHLAAHVKNADARDADFWRISSELEAQAPEGFLPRKPMEIPSGSSFLFDSVDRVFFCGDLNYRLDLPRELTEHAILHEDSESVEHLLQHDQLIHSMAEGRAFPKFGEGKIAFMPTFKYDKESSSYDTSHKQRIPAWTDRILFQPSNGIRVLDYQSVPEAQSSDHRPVWGSYRIGMEGKVIPPAPKKKKRRKRVDYEQDYNY